MIGIVKGAIGIVQSINPTKYTATVKLVDYENNITGEMQILSSLTYQNKIVQLPKVGTPVFCIFIGEQSNSGFIIGGLFSDKNPSDSQDGYYAIDLGASKVEMFENGEIKFKANKTIIDSQVEITKDLKVMGKTIVQDIKTQNIDAEEIKARAYLDK